MILFVDHTKRSAAELAADLSACRQFRHISADYYEKIITRAYEAAAKCWIGPKAIKHPDPNNPCTNCGQPRSKFTGGNRGLCYRCYASEGKNIRDLWVEDVFITAVEMRGFTCDCCNEIARPDDHEVRRNAVINMMASMDGAVRPVFCLFCISDFKGYCSRNFGKGSWRHAPERNLEKMLIAFLAQKVKSLAERVKSAA